MVCLGNICRSPLGEGILKSKLPIEKLDFKNDNKKPDILQEQHPIILEVLRIKGV